MCFRVQPNWERKVKQMRGKQRLVYCGEFGEFEGKKSIRVVNKLLAATSLRNIFSILHVSVFRSDASSKVRGRA